MTTTQIIRNIALTAAIAISASLVAPVQTCAQSAAKTESPRKVMNSEELYEYALKSTCWVCLPKSSGTGWVLDKEKRLIVTNHHVVDGFDEVKVFFPVKKGDNVLTDPNWYVQTVKPIAGRVIDRNKHQDLSIIQLESMPSHIAALPLAANSAKQGQEIMTIGGDTRGSNGLWGWVDGKVRNVVDGMTPTGKLRQVESNVSTNSGNSGGPVINNRGELVAVHFASSLEARNVSYHVDLTELRTFLTVAMPIVGPNDAAGFIARGDRRLTTGRNAAARDDFAAAIKADAKNARAYLGRGMANQNLGDSATAILDLDEAIKLNPEYYMAFYVRGEPYFFKKQFEIAAENYTQAIRINPKSANAYNQRGRSYHEQKKYADAEGDYGRAIELNPTAAYLWQNRGSTREDLGKLDEALEDMQKGIECSPRSAQVYSNLGYMLSRAKRHEDAKQIHYKADELDIKNPIHAENAGRCWQMQDKYEVAIKLFDLAMKRAETYEGNYKPDACFCSRGFCLRRLENYEGSLADHNRSLKINLNRAETYYQRAWTYRWMGQYNLAKEDFDKSVSLDATYASKEAPVVVRTTSSYYSGFRR